MERFERRRFLEIAMNLGGAALGCALPNFLRGASPEQLLQADPNEFIFSRFKYVTLTSVADNWDTHPVGDERLLSYLRESTNVKVSPLSWEQRVVQVDDFSTLYKRPFLFMTGEGEFRFSDAEAEALGEHFRRGGFLYGDDCVAQHQDHFFQAMMRELPRALPGYQWEPVPPDHEIYHCFFDMPGGRSPHCNGRVHPDQGIFMNGRLVAFLTSGDVHCGWVGRFWTPELQEQCLKMGINIIVHSLTH